MSFMSRMSAAIKIRLKWLLYPGLNLHARLRYKWFYENLTPCANAGEMRLLDAGSGNGMLSYQAYRRGYDVVGVSFKSAEVRGSKALFNEYLGISTNRLKFIEGNLYELEFEDSSLDVIICAEVLEHLVRDTDVCRAFWRILKPGGRLHVCAPNARHPYNESFPLDLTESGGHVRPGYTPDTYKALLEPVGFSIVEYNGLGGKIRQSFNWRIKRIQENYGAIAGLPYYFLSMPFIFFEKSEQNLDGSFSIHALAIKPKQNP